LGPKKNKLWRVKSPYNVFFGDTGIEHEFDEYLNLKWMEFNTKITGTELQKLNTI
jgi:hypothetical protein